jgi:ribonuclease HII
MKRAYIGLEFDRAICADPNLAIAGVDEVGRGALFGPVVAAAVILPATDVSALVAAQMRDSKQLSASRRQKLAEKIYACALAWGVGFASSTEIDQINILQASLLCLVDGIHAIKDLTYPQQTLVKGDEKSLAIASASIIAKVWRDDLIVRLSTKYPLYDLEANKGYGTARHLQALRDYGASPLHRMSFRPCQVEVAALGGKTGA